jgi:hypothetical protein
MDPLIETKPEEDLHSVSIAFVVNVVESTLAKQADLCAASSTWAKSKGGCLEK